MVSTSIGLVGYGRIGSYLATQIEDDPDLTVNFVFDIEEVIEGIEATTEGPTLLTASEDLYSQSVDLVVEAANADVVREHAPEVLRHNNMLIMSVTALADQEVKEELRTTCEENGTTLYVPHGALLGMDGLQDARSTLEEVKIETHKNPDNIDFRFTDRYDADDIDAETVLYEGPTRAICDQYPRNVNSHAIVALSGIGFDETKSVLVADPAAMEATHHIVAEGTGTVLEVVRSTEIAGVTGEYTLASIWGTVERVARQNSTMRIF